MRSVVKQTFFSLTHSTQILILFIQREMCMNKHADIETHWNSGRAVCSYSLQLCVCVYVWMCLLHWMEWILNSCCHVCARCYLNTHMCVLGTAGKWECEDSMERFPNTHATAHNCKEAMMWNQLWVFSFRWCSAIASFMLLFRQSIHQTPITNPFA